MSCVGGMTGEFQVWLGLTRIWSTTSSVCDAFTPTFMKNNGGLSLTGRSLTGIICLTVMSDVCGLELQ